MTNQQTRWMSIREAALALGVSELTVRRRIKDGKLVHRSENGKYYVDLAATPDETAGARPHLRAVPSRHDVSPADDTVEVDVIDREPLTDQTRVTDQDPVSSEVETAERMPAGERPDPVSGPLPGLDLDALLREHARLAEVAGRAGAIEEQLRALESRHAALQDGVISLSNRNGWLESRLEDRESEIKLLTDSRHRIPWWKRLFGSAEAGS